MRKTKIKKYIIIVVILSSLVVLTNNTEGCIGNVRVLYPPPYFHINILCLDTEPMRNVWAEIIANELRKIGIGVNSIESLSYEEIAQRTWDYDGPYPIPTHAEGGYDLLFIDRNWDLDIDMKGLFDTPSWSPTGDNIYQYSSPEMDWAIGNFSQAFVLADKIQYAHDIQALLYEDLPAITILYNYAFYYMTENITGINPLLWYKKAETMAKWEHPVKSNLSYGTYDLFKNFHPLKNIHPTTCRRNQESIDLQWLNQIYSSLVKRESSSPYNGYIVPFIATDFYSDDGFNYTVNLDSKAKWADGITLNATDVKYSFDLFENMTGYSYGADPIEWNLYDVEILDEFQVKIEFLQGYVYQSSQLELPLLPYHIWKEINYEDHEEYAKNWTVNHPEKMFGAGPYKLESLDEVNKVIHLTKNPYYKNLTNADDPVLEDIYFVSVPTKEEAMSELATGRIDMVDYGFFTYPEEFDIPNLQMKFALNLQSEEIAINVKHPFLSGTLAPISSEDSGKYLRKAISHIIPRNHLIITTLNDFAEPGITPWPVNHFMADEDLEPYEYNPDTSIQNSEFAGFVYPCATDVASVFISSIFCAVCVVTVVINKTKIKAKKKNMKEKA
ncbi:MAG: hypothetical protein GPJ52_08185 [Candidatus Heimdallarchaeota archaeon]|nr:hypothetical protein [Candidatus Heimdallarchaeota archaeon]